MKKHIHELIGPNLSTGLVSCWCGYDEPADPSDIKEQLELLEAAK